MGVAHPLFEPAPANLVALAAAPRQAQLQCLRVGLSNGDRREPWTVQVAFAFPPEPLIHIVDTVHHPEQRSK